MNNVLLKTLLIIFMNLLLNLYVFSNNISTGYYDMHKKICVDTLNGSVKRYHKNGMLLEDTYYLKGVKNGYSNIYYKNGKLCGAYMYKNGEFDGLCKQYDTKGRITKEVYFTNGAFDGKWVSYINGKKAVEATFSRGKIDGWYYDYYKNGAIHHKTFYNVGRIVTGESTYRKDGTLKRELISNKIANRLVMQVDYDRKGDAINRQRIDELPLAYYIFGKIAF